MRVHLLRISPMPTFGEKLLLVFVRDTDTRVLHRKYEFVVIFLERNRDRARGRIADGIVNQIAQYMVADLRLVTRYLIIRIICNERNRQPLLLRCWARPFDS